MNSLQGTLLSQIDEWQNQIMEKVHQSADEARNQVKELLLNKIKDVEQELEEITKQLQKLQETKNYVEKNIKLIEENFGLLREKFSRITEPPSIKLDVERTKQIDWSSLICVDNAEKKVNVRCSSAHIKCPWLGLQNQLEDHLKTCIFEPLRLEIETLNKQTTEQKTQIENYNTEIRRLNVQLQQCHDQIPKYTHEIDQLKKEREQLKTQIRNNGSDIPLLKRPIQQLRIKAKEKEQKQEFAPPGAYQILDRNYVFLMLSLINTISASIYSEKRKVDEQNYCHQQPYIV
ncbi:unnamed protein product [Rotaria sordida]|uniref:Uncharacterized protein n=1 Tax=Rotaria sordida TaxID=392033 RepID=A0A815W2Y4_9BILA|nr:unnamed protein product [Rotaria sordida]CAF1538261.1 unnamed protein product [Rotaria sordida]